MRRVQPEILDHLPTEDPRARRSRNDLRRVNAWMGNARWLAMALDPGWVASDRGLTVTDLGTGDGLTTLAALIRWRRRSPVPSPGGTSDAGRHRLMLVDRHPVVSAATLARFRGLGLRPTVVADDARNALGRPDVVGGDIVLTNLFLHHLEDGDLPELLSAVAGACRVFVACEPRRSAWGRWGARLLWCIGCNGVTRHDARVSVEAGFLDGEISGMWPKGEGWRLEERRAGLFSHLFVAIRGHGGNG